MLAQLTKQEPAGYPQLPAARRLLTRKQVECQLVDVWSRWHDDNGDPVEAANALETFLVVPGVRAVLDAKNPTDPLLIYVAHLLTALLGSEYPGKAFQFANKEPSPDWLGGTLLGRYFQEYETLRQTTAASQEHRLQIAADDAATLAKKLTVPWLRVLAYELWAEVILAARQDASYRDGAMKGRLGDLVDILCEWRRLWPGENPLEGAHFFESKGQKRRAARIRRLLGALAWEYRMVGSRDGVQQATKILELFEVQERVATKQTSLGGVSLQQLWEFLETSGNEQARLVLEVKSADESEIEDWIESQHPYARWGACPKAVLFAELSFDRRREVNARIDDLLQYLQTRLAGGEAYSASVESFRRTYWRGQSDEQLAQWIWLRVHDTGPLGALAFAVELRRSVKSGILTWLVHTLIELDPIDPDAGYAAMHKALLLVDRSDEDVKDLRQLIVVEVTNLLASVAP